MIPDPSANELETVLAAYLAADGTGETPDRDELIHRHPDLAGELAAFFADHDRMRRVTAPLRQLLGTDRGTRPGSEPLPPQGRFIGAYELLEEIGRGGMGIVYRARHPALGRVVALKMILAGVTASAAEVHRLRAEAEAVATLDHPSIVPLYEVGEHDGQPFFTMKLVPGTTLTAQAADFRAAPHAIARLVATLARAVQHAHERGILHRDLKPANVLLDAEGRPYLTDFGLARRLGGMPGPTQTGVAVGTPSYIAPEQATGPGHAVTTAADVYSLGAILYELLTGQPPFRGATALDVLHRLLHEEPPRPRTIHPAVPADLETVCLKCLEKDPTRRYASAAALAEDLEAFARGDPIQARAVHGARRLWRWCRRQPIVAGLAFALTVSLLAGLAVSLGLWRRAERERAREEESFRLAHRAVNEFNGLLSEQLAGIPGMQPLRRRSLELTRAYLEEFLRRHGQTTELRTDLAEARLRLATVLSDLSDPAAADEALKAETLYADLLRSHPQDPILRRQQASVWSLFALLHARRGESADALAAYRRAATRYEEVVREVPEDADARAGMARIANNLGSLHHDRGRHTEAKMEWEKARALYEELAARFPMNGQYRRGLAHVLHNLGVLLGNEGRHQAARDIYRQSVEIQRRLVREQPQNTSLRHGLAVELHHLAMELGTLGIKEESRKADREAFELREKLARENPDVLDYQIALAASCMSQGSARSADGRPAEALALFRQAAALLAEQARRDPSRVLTQLDLSRSEFRIGLELARARQRREAIEAYRRAESTATKLAASHPDLLEAREQLSQVLNNLALLLSEEGKHDLARQAIRRAIDQGKHLVAAAPKVPRHGYLLRVFLAVLGQVERRDGRLDAAAEALRERARLSAGDGDELVRTTGEFARTAAAVGQGRSTLSTEELAQRRRYVKMALATLRQALEAGYRDLARLRRAADLAVLRADPEFEATLKAFER